MQASYRHPRSGRVAHAMRIRRYIALSDDLLSICLAIASIVARDAPVETIVAAMSPMIRISAVP